VDTKKRIFAETRRKMAPDGYLMLGAAETPLSLDSEFVRVKAESGGCYRLGGAH
jgi:chemotaxis methyl-accepting protein methylase